MEGLLTAAFTARAGVRGPLARRPSMPGNNALVMSRMADGLWDDSWIAAGS